MTPKEVAQKLIDVGASRGNIWIQRVGINIQEDPTISNIEKGEEMLKDLGK